MPATKSQIAASIRYRDKNLDRIELTVKKGKKNEYKLEAEKRGLNLMEMIRNSIDEFIVNHPVDEK